MGGGGVVVLETCSCFVLLGVNSCFELLAVNKRSCQPCLCASNNDEFSADILCLVLWIPTHSLTHPLLWSTRVVGIREVQNSSRLWHQGFGGAKRAVVEEVVVVVRGLTRLSTR